jgi:acetylornithine deacetylase/succinyl-diaminopimelate desuccinylase-like protein
VVCGKWLEAGPETPTLLAYGHYDVQPVDPIEEWRAPPFEPTIQGDNVYCRGASDDKGQLFAILAAVEAYIETGGRMPINRKLILEGEEEISNPRAGGGQDQYAAGSRPRPGRNR